MRKFMKSIVATSFIIVIAGCGNTQGQRALSGGAIGAGVGTAGAVLLNANPVAGAVIGGATGATTGALTTKKNINFGDIK